MATDLDPRLTTSAGDVGLLALRIGIGAPMPHAGLKKLLEFNTTVTFMESGGWSAPAVATFMVSFAETVGGLGLLLGLLTPPAAMAVVAAMIDAWAVTVSGAPFWSDPFNLPFVLGFGAAASLFTGAGAYSMDERLWGRATWPRLVTITLFVVAIVAAVVTWVVLNGTNPIHVTTPGN
jgi:putative oxidoreductase